MWVFKDGSWAFHTIARYFEKYGDGQTVWHPQTTGQPALSSGVFTSHPAGFTGQGLRRIQTVRNIELGFEMERPIWIISSSQRLASLGGLISSTVNHYQQCASFLMHSARA